jgi:hypothetical protein
MKKAAAKKKDETATTVAEIRMLEKSVVLDPTKQVNNILKIREYLRDEGVSLDVRLTSLHALRRIFVEFLEGGRMCLGTSSSSSSGDSSKAREYKLWLQQQLAAYQECMCSLISANNEDFVAPCVRTFLELISREHLLKQSAPRFGFKTLQQLVQAFASAHEEIDVDVLLMLRAELFSKADCAFYTLRVLRTLLASAKRSSSSSGSGSSGSVKSVEQLTQNALDLLRVLSVPQAIDPSTFLVSADAEAEAADDEEEGGEGGEGGESESDSEGYDDENDDDGKKRKIVTHRRLGKKAPAPASASASGAKGKRRRTREMSAAEQLTDRASHQRVFAKAWLALLALPLTKQQHKIALKHLPDHVMDEMGQSRALLLADYLSSSYKQGGMLAVLALEGLFQLIARHNLDHPRFFESLYALCTTETLGAKYRAKFTRLLSMALKSTNLPAYLVAAFVKRLAFLALQSPTPSALYCLAQVTVLLRTHPACHVLLHASSSSSSSSSSAPQPYHHPGQKGFDLLEEGALDQAGALGSSLWEAEALLSHHSHQVAALALSLKDPFTTAPPSSVAALKGAAFRAPLKVEEHTDHTYATLFEAELKELATAGGKRNTALAVRPPLLLLPEGELVQSCFA